MALLMRSDFTPHSAPVDPAFVSAHLGDRVIRIGTRGSPLALAQAHEVRQRLMAAWPILGTGERVQIIPMVTAGDRIQDRTLVEIGGKGLFTEEIEHGLLDHSLDIAVHSMKDMPALLPSGLEMGALLPRADVRDAFISRDGGDVMALPPGAKIGTASLRRQAMMRALRPDCVVVPLRGNVGTRLDKLHNGVVDATLLAVAGLVRLGRDDVLASASLMAPDQMLPAVGQGAIGIENRTDDPLIKALLAAIACMTTQAEITVERAFLAELDGSCRTPIGGLARLLGNVVHFNGVVAAPDGSAVWRQQGETSVPPTEKLHLLENFGREQAKNLRNQMPAGFMSCVTAKTEKAL